MRAGPLDPIWYAIVFVAAFASTLLTTPIAIRVAHRLGIVDRPASHKFHQVPTPYLGGAAIALTVLISMSVQNRAARLQVVVIILCGFAVALTGLIDDWRTIGPMPRLLIQSAAAVTMWTVGVRVQFVQWDPASLALTVLWVVGVTNAINLLDNMDAVLPGTAAIAAGFFFLIAFRSEQSLVALMTIALSGACLGFLPYNFSPARIFLGDTGSLFIGFLLAVAGIKIRLPIEPSAFIQAAVPCLILAAPLFDTALVVFSRLRGGRGVFVGGTDHTSHRIVALGAPPPFAALYVYAASAVCGGIALSLLLVQPVVAYWSLGVVTVAAVALAWFFERVELGTTGVLAEAGDSARVGAT